MVFYAFRALEFGIVGLRHFTKQAFESKSVIFNQNDLNVSLEGKRCIVTGANQGIGYCAARELSKRGAQVIIVCRNPQRGEEARNKLIQESGNPNISLKICDVSQVSQVHQLCNDLLAEDLPVHILIHNAGCMVHERKIVEGFETNFATNVLSNYIITSSLKPLLTKASESKVIFVSSGGMLTQKLEFDDFNYEKHSKFDGQSQYAKNKRQQVAMGELFQKKFGGTNLKFVSMHPGWVATAAVSESLPDFEKRMKNKLRSPEQGADTIVWLSCKDSKSLEGGEFYFDREVAHKHLTGAGTKYSDATAEEFWAALSSLAPSSSTEL